MHQSRLALPKGVAWLLHQEKALSLLILSGIALQVLVLLAQVTLPAGTVDGRLMAGAERVANILVLIALLLVLWQVLPKGAMDPWSRRSPRDRSPQPPEAASGIIEINGQRFADPFDIPAGCSGLITPEQVKTIFDIIESRYHDLLEEGFQDPEARALLLCDRQIVGRARTPEALDLDHIEQIERQRDRVCFLYGKEDLIEECPWSPVGGPGRG
jgi:hypothetical protein